MLHNSPESTHSRSPISRRGFVKTAAASAVLAGGAGTAAAALPKFFAHAAGADRIRLGLVGCGGRGTGAATQALRADPGCELVAMGDVFADRLSSSLSAITEEMGDEAAAKVQVPSERQFTGFDACERVLASGVDAVLLTGYPVFRPAQLALAIEAGKHVFLEKPVAVDGPGVRSVLESAQKARDRNLACLVGFCWRFNAGMRACFEKINGGTIGEVTSVYTNYLTGTLGKRPRKPEWSDLEFQMRNWWHFTWIGGDHIVEQAIHSIDRLAWAVGDRIPARVTCLGGRAARSGPESGHVFDHFSAIYEYEGGLRTHHACRQIDNCPGDNSDYVYGSKGRATVNGWTPTYECLDHSGKEIWKHSGDIQDMYQVEHNELFASIRAGKPINDCERGARSTLMAIMARMAAYTGQSVTWEQALNSTERLGPERYDFGQPLEAPPVAVPGQTKLI